MSNLISPEELRTRLGQPGLRIVDTRFDLADPEAGRRAYEDGHIVGAIYAHLDEDLSGPTAEHGGRHPLPEPAELARTLGRLGISNGHSVVAYDEGSGMFASRLWWLLRYLGHEHVQVLDGGMRAWQENGYPVSSGEEMVPAALFEPAPRADMTVGRDEVLRALEREDSVLVDARAPERYRGEVEPIDPRAGHIPTAINLPFAGNLQDGRFREPAELRERYAPLEKAGEVIVYCGSGVSAAHDILAMEEAGIENVRLYPGSWSDWTSYDDAPVATGEEE